MTTVLDPALDLDLTIAPWTITPEFVFTDAVRDDLTVSLARTPVSPYLAYTGRS